MQSRFEGNNQQPGTDNDQPDAILMKMKAMGKNQDEDRNRRNHLYKVICDDISNDPLGIVAPDVLLDEIDYSYVLEHNCLPPEWKEFFTELNRRIEINSTYNDRSRKKAGLLREFFADYDTKGTYMILPGGKKIIFLPSEPQDSYGALNGGISSTTDNTTITEDNVLDVAADIMHNNSYDFFLNDKRLLDTIRHFFADHPDLDRFVNKIKAESSSTFICARRVVVTIALLSLTAGFVKDCIYLPLKISEDHRAKVTKVIKDADSGRQEQNSDKINEKD